MGLFGNRMKPPAPSRRGRGAGTRVGRIAEELVELEMGVSDGKMGRFLGPGLEVQLKSWSKMGVSKGFGRGGKRRERFWKSFLWKGWGQRMAPGGRALALLEGDLCSIPIARHVIANHTALPIQAAFLFSLPCPSHGVKQTTSISQLNSATVPEKITVKFSHFRPFCRKNQETGRKTLLFMV